MMVEPSWWKYAIFDDNGLCGISKEAPEEEKKKYNEYAKEIEKYKKENKPIPK